MTIFERLIQSKIDDINSLDVRDPNTLISPFEGQCVVKVWDGPRVRAAKEKKVEEARRHREESK